uniref:Uncharacterized protein n=1 Tax=Setaria italica TaxID=4555 RepID=K3ZG04_SETIT
MLTAMLCSKAVKAMTPISEHLQQPFLLSI